MGKWQEKPYKDEIGKAIWLASQRCEEIWDVGQHLPSFKIPISADRMPEDKEIIISREEL